MTTVRTRSTPTLRSARSFLAALLVAVPLLAAPFAGADLTPLDPARPVFQGVSGNQTCPVVDAGHGDYVVGWQHDRGNSDLSLHLRRFDERGRPQNQVATVGNTFTSSIPDGSECAPYAVVSADGGSLGFWSITGRSGPFASIEHQVFVTPVTAAGATSESLPASADGNTSVNGLAAAAIGDGTSLGAWRDPAGVGDLAARLFDADGVPVAEGEDIAAWGAPQVVALAGQLFLVAGVSQGDPAPAGGLAGQLVGTGGLVGEPFAITDEPARLAARPQGGFIAAWVDGADLAFRVFANDGAPRGPVRITSTQDDAAPFQSPGYDVDEVAVAAVPISNGGPDVFVLAWRQTADGGGEQRIYARTVDLDGNHLGPKVAVSEAGAEVSGPVLASATPGSVLAAWSAACPSCNGTPDTRVSVRTFAVTPGATPIGLDGRFRVTVTWKDFEDDAGLGIPVPFSDDTVAFWFFRPSNLELMIKVLDGRPVNGHFWVFGGALSTVEYEVTVTDTESDQVWTYKNPSGELNSFADTEAFDP